MTHVVDVNLGGICEMGLNRKMENSAIDRLIVFLRYLIRILESNSSFFYWIISLIKEVKSVLQFSIQLSTFLDH